MITMRCQYQLRHQFPSEGVGNTGNDGNYLHYIMARNVRMMGINEEHLDDENGKFEDGDNAAGIPNCPTLAPLIQISTQLSLAWTFDEEGRY